MSMVTLEDVISEYREQIRNTLGRLGVATSDLDDVEQEVLRAVARGLEQFDPLLSSDPEQAFRRWIWEICRRQAASHRRARLCRREVLFDTGEMDCWEGEAPGAEAHCLMAERTALLSALLEQLDPQRRAVLVAYELDGVPMVDVATRLGISANTAWTRLRLGLADLRTAWIRMTSGRAVSTGSLGSGGQR